MSAHLPHIDNVQDDNGQNGIVQTGTVRDATPADAEACAAIYAPYVRDTAITFETEEPDANEIASRILTAQRDHAWLVLENEGRVVGYAYAAKFAGRAAYRWATEVSVYLDRTATGRGGGSTLYAALLPRLTRRGFQIAMACMTVPNDPSLRLHEKLGFVRVATLPDIGWKHGAWHSTAWLQLRLVDAATAAPAELR